MNQIYLLRTFMGKVFITPDHKFFIAYTITNSDFSAVF